jgi:fused signal recognition particle receptor
VAVKQAQELEQADQKGLYQRLQERLKKTRDSFVSRVDTLFLGKKEIDAQLLDELEEILITADLGVNTTMDLLDEIRQKVSRKELSDPQAIKFALKERILSFFEGYDAAGMQLSETGPFVIMVVGVNGVGKTTTIGKIAYKFASSGQRVLLIAADTFRAAAIEQLQVWGERVGAEVVARKQGADPSSVIYDGLDFAAAKDFDVIIIDTAGRLHTKVNLMEELKKIKRVVNKKIAGAPHEVMLVLDATTGQNSISQARLFNEAVDITGLTLTKLDGTAKGGIVVNICHDFNIPIRFIGIGEKLEDLRDFDPQEFIEALFVNGSQQ